MTNNDQKLFKKNFKRIKKTEIKSECLCKCNPKIKKRCCWTVWIIILILMASVAGFFLWPDCNSECWDSYKNAEK
jgi:hypothetical protein